MSDLELAADAPATKQHALITAADIARAQGILRRWLEHARRTANKQAEADTRLLMRVLSGLYTEAK